MSWKIVADSGCDLREVAELAPQTSFVRVPLTLQIGNQIFVDDEGLNIEDMMATLYGTPAAASSACPSPDAFLQAYEGADNVIVVTITGNLSGSYNAARLAKEMFQETNPNRKIHVIDSLSAGGECDLLVEEINRLIAQGLSFEEVVDGITAYQEKTKLLFVLAKVDNLVKNGRLSKLVGKVVGLLNIRMVGEASSQGTLELLQKARGQKKAVQASYDEMRKAGYQGGRVLIAHCNNEKICQSLRELIQKDFPQAQVQAIPTSGLCSFYAEDGGILLGYEVE
ncbi:DegV family protein [Streptococcus loxodontisalivarius]|uniref:DegV family protein with EDD domain n=1 Tax=Streptococcus loxodontisalivarius TaxID=1349415 RepID=A0ABS2PQR4_9STRE|nr:DegV family protein [Streptococcus loxodontisalivarius]MBM7642251.1 DegV family protein with EDD domain [Streptococcus loxodontisalivarius]